MNDKQLLLILEDRKEYIRKHYSSNDQKIALFEVETLEKIVTSVSTKQPEKVTRVRMKDTQLKNGLFN
jgi:hypothetical protein